MLKNPLSQIRCRNNAFLRCQVQATVYKIYLDGILGREARESSQNRGGFGLISWLCTALLIITSPLQAYRRRANTAQTNVPQENHSSSELFQQDI